MENLLLALLVGIVAGICGWDAYGGFHMGTVTPLVVGTIMGLVLGDVQTGLYVGASLQFVYLGSFGIGAAIPPDACSATAISTALCIIAKLDKDVAISLAVPVATLAQVLNMLIWTFNGILMHAADKNAAVGDIDGACRWHVLGSVLFFFQGFTPAFLAVLLGAPYVEGLVGAMPEVILGWLRLAGSMLPAVGFAMLFIMMNKPKLTPYFIVGFVLAAAMGGTLISVGLLGLAAALLYVDSADKSGSSERKTRRMSDMG